MKWFVVVLSSVLLFACSDRRRSTNADANVGDAAEDALITGSGSGQSNGTACDDLAGAACDVALGCKRCALSGSCVSADQGGCDCGDAANPTACDLPGGDCNWCGDLNACLSDSASCMTPRLVFVSSSVHTGNLGGLSGADNICQTLASNAGLPGTFKAWLSSDSQTVKDRLSLYDIRYELVNGTKVADGQSDLLSAQLDHAIDRDEQNNQVPVTSSPVCSVSTDKPVWTGTTTSGGLNPPTCGNWTSTGTEGANVGAYNASDHNWTAYCSDQTISACSSNAHLYCFQQ